MTLQPRPDRRHIAHFLDTVRRAGATIADEGGRLVVRGDASGLLQREVTAREGRIREWWASEGVGRESR